MNKREYLKAFFKADFKKMRELKKGKRIEIRPASKFFEGIEVPPKDKIYWNFQTGRIEKI